MGELPVLIDDRVFSLGDPCFRMVFLIAGELCYRPRREDNTVVTTTVPAGPRTSHKDGTSATSRVTVGPYSSLSEPVLWTAWENCGDLHAMADSTILTLGVDHFIRVLQEHS